MDKDAISRALEDIGRPLHADGYYIYGHDEAGVPFAVGKVFDVQGPMAQGYAALIVAAVNSFDPLREQQVAALVQAATAYRKAHRDLDDYTVAVETGDAVYTLRAEAILSQDIDTARDALFVALARVTPQEADHEPAE